MSEMSMNPADLSRITPEHGFWRVDAIDVAWGIPIHFFVAHPANDFWGLKANLEGGGWSGIRAIQLTRLDSQPPKSKPIPDHWYVPEALEIEKQKAIQSKGRLTTYGINTDSSQKLRSHPPQRPIVRRPVVGHAPATSRR